MKLNENPLEKTFAQVEGDKSLNLNNKKEYNSNKLFFIPKGA